MKFGELKKRLDDKFGAQNRRWFEVCVVVAIIAFVAGAVLL